MPMHIEDKKDLQSRLIFFANGNDEKYSITRLEANYLSSLVNEDWRR